MESIRFTRFLLLVLVSLHTQESSAHKNQTTEKVLDANRSSLEASSSKIYVEKEVYDGVPAAYEYAEATTLVGRRMMNKKKFEAAIAKEERSGGVEPKSPGAASSAGNCNRIRRKGITNIECKLRSNRRSPNRAMAKIASFTAFSADYHVPRSHPPKNN